MWKTVSSFQHHWWALALGKGRSAASLLPLLAGCSPSEVTQWAKTAARIRVKWDTLQKCRLRQHAHRYTYKWERSASVLWESFLRGPVCAPCLHSLTSLSWDLVWYPINHLHSWGSTAFFSQHSLHKARYQRRRAPAFPDCAYVRRCSSWLVTALLRCHLLQRPPVTHSCRWTCLTRFLLLHSWQPERVSSLKKSSYL